jgi:hypothetical protein
MSLIFDIELIPLFNLYLALIFVASTVLRIRQYHAILVIVRTLPGRWPRLFQLVKQHRGIFLTWGTVLPLAVTLGLLLLQTLASRWVWPEARLSLHQLLDLWPGFVLVALCAVAMICFDVYGTLQVGEIDRPELEKHFDQAEYWLKSWTAPVVRIFTFGYVNPRQIVNDEIRKSLVQASAVLNYNLWWVSVQAGLRLATGLALWCTYAVHHWFHGQ